MSTQNLVKQIHNEFDTAADRLLKEAKKIIDEPFKADEEKSARLKKLGFLRSPIIVTERRATEKRKAALEVVDSINYFKQKYPVYKFITENEVERICKKYGLLLGDADAYTGDIPEKNIREMEKFKMDKNDYFFSGLEWARVLIRGYDTMIGKSDRPEFSASEKPSFKIVASVKDFDTKNMNIKGYKLEKNIPDPIVLQPVKNGYLVVTAWGDEASDPAVVNEINN